MDKRTSIWLGIAGAVGAAGFWVYKSSRASVENAPYTVELSDGDFEIRQYPELRVATARSKVEHNDAFGKLNDYISGENDANAKIAMTTPIFIDLDDDAGLMNLVIPQAMQDSPPEARVPGVEIATREPVRVAVYRFRGTGSDKNIADAESHLRECIEDHDLETTEDPMVLAYYDAPFIPPFLRRNEVMLTLAE